MEWWAWLLVYVGLAVGAFVVAISLCKYNRTPPQCYGNKPRHTQWQVEWQCPSCPWGDECAKGDM